MRQTTLASAQKTAEEDDPVAAAAPPRRQTRKRSTQRHPVGTDGVRSKRIKEEDKGMSEIITPEPKKKPTRRRKKKVNDDFAFGIPAASVEYETPKLPRKSDVVMEDVELDDSPEPLEVISEEQSSAASADSDDTTSSVSIRAVGSSKKISKAAAKRAKRGDGKSRKASEELAMGYAQFDPCKAATWQKERSVPFSVLAETLAAIEGTTKRLEIARLLTELFLCILATTPEDLLPAVYLCVNAVGPAHEGLELGVGDSILIKAIASVSGCSEAKVKKQYSEEGDLGSVAISQKGGQNLLMGFQPLSIAEVFKRFVEIAMAAGDRSQDRKRQTIERLLNASKGTETKFITRSLQGKLRIGLAEQTVLQCIGQAFFLYFADSKDPKTLMQQMEKSVEVVKQGFSTCPSYELLIETAAQYGLADLKDRLTLTPGIPVQPMLAKPTTGVAEVLQKFSDIPFTCEYKYDGERSQIHVLEDKSVLIYSRSAENVTEKYPDVVQRIPQHLKRGVSSVVLDCESVAFDPVTRQILPFQRLSTRARKDVKIANIKPLTERREALYSTVKAEPGLVQFAEHRTSTDVEELQSFLDLAVQNSTEGLIVKTLDCTYEPSKRSVNWLKLKKDYLEGVGDSFDLVVIVYDPVNDEFQSISKIGTGFSDEDLENHTRTLKEIQIDRSLPSYNVDESLVPDVWFHPEVIWEVKAADISISPVHRAAYGILEDDTKGISIRFPRLIRVREDKKAKDATTAEQVLQMYKDQAA